MLKRFVSSALLAAIGLAGAQENYGQWSFRKNITVNTTPAGINIPQNVLSYPMLVRLGPSDAAIFNQAGANGASLRFTRANGTTRLPHSIDHWDAAGQSAAIWVLADTVFGNNAQGVDFRMFWGKVGAPDSAKASAVFDTTNGFVAVWHLGGGNGTAARPNSVTGGNPAVPANFASGYAPIKGAIGSADTLTGGNRDGGTWLNLGQGYGTWGGKLTMSMWIKPGFASGAGFRQFLSLSNGTNNTPGRDNIWMGHGGCCGSENRFTTEIVNGTSAGGWNISHDSAVVGHPNWQLLGWTVADGNKVVLYRNGDSVGARTSPQSLKDTVRAANHIGRAPWDDPVVAGAVDEARLAKTVRSKQWMRLDYLTQVPGSAAVTLGATDTLNPFVVISDLRYQAGNTDAIDTLSLRTFSALNITPTYVGQQPDSFSVSGTLPAGAAFNKTTGALTGTPTAVFNELRTFTAHVGASTATRDVRFVVTTGIANLRYVPTNTASRDTLFMNTGAAVNVVPQYSGGPADSIKLTGNTVTMPAGITMNKTTGAFTGTPTATFTGNRTVTAYFGNQTTTRDIRFVVTLGPTTSFNYSGEAFTLNAGESFTGAVPSWSGRAPTSFTATPALPAGLVLNAQTGVITGTPTAAAANLAVTIRAANATDTVTKALTFTVAAATADGAYATAWSRHATLTLNTTASGANVTGTVAKFPVLVRLGAADTLVFGTAHATGRDLRFTKMDNTTRLPHQIDHWDNAGKSAAVWVLLDSVVGNDNTQSIRMHWGNASASPLSNGNAVFDTANGFVAVWHLGGGNETALRGNAVAGGNPAVPEFFPTGYVAPRGVIGTADTLRGGTQAAGDRLNLGTGYGNWGGAMTMSMWVKPHAVDLAQWNQYMSLSNGQAQDNIWMGRQGNNQNFTTEIYSGTQSGGHTHATNVQVQGEWQLLTWTVSNSTQVTMYRNGAPLAVTRSDNANDPAISSQPLKDTLRVVNHIGRAAWPDPTIEAMVDEARLSKVARSANWIKLEYENQKPTQSLVSIKVDSIPTSLAGAALLGEALSFRAVQNGVMFNLRTDKAVNARIEVIDMRGRAVWSRSLKTTTGLNQVLWSGRSEQGAGSGVYFVRMLLLDENNVPTHRLERKLPMTH